MFWTIAVIYEKWFIQLQYFYWNCLIKLLWTKTIAVPIMFVHAVAASELARDTYYMYSAAAVARFCLYTKDVLGNVVSERVCHSLGVSFPKPCVPIFQLEIPLKRWCYYANSLGLGAMSLCRHKWCRTYDLTLLLLTTIVNIASITNTVQTRAWP